MHFTKFSRKTSSTVAFESVHQILAQLGTMWFAFTFGCFALIYVVLTVGAFETQPTLAFVFCPKVDTCSVVATRFDRTMIVHMLTLGSVEAGCAFALVAVFLE